jgi:hypothetical protein
MSSFRLTVFLFLPIRFAIVLAFTIGSGAPTWGFLNFSRFHSRIKALTRRFYRSSGYGARCELAGLLQTGSVDTPDTPGFTVVSAIF